MLVGKVRTRVATVALVACTGFVLAACSSATTSSDAASEAASGGAASTSASTAAADASSEDCAVSADPVTLNYWTWFPAEATLKKSIAEYEGANPGITIELREFEAADWQKQLPLALNGGQDLDVVGVQVSAMTNSAKSGLLPVDQWPGLPAGWQDQINPTMLQQTQDIAEDNVLYSIPLGTIGSAVVYTNQDILTKAGVTAFPSTAAEWLDAVTKVKALGGDILPVAFNGDSWFQNEMFFSVADQIDPFLSDKLYTGELAWDSPEMVQALTAYQDLYNTGVLDTATLSMKNDTPRTEYNSGNAAFLIDGSWSSSVLSADYRTANNIAIGDASAGAFPVAIEGGQPAARTYAEGGLAIPTNSTHQCEASKFIQYMAMGDGVDTWAGDLVLAPSLVGYTVPSTVLTTPAAQEGYQVVQGLLGAPGSGRGSVVTTFTPEVLDVQLLDLARGKIDPAALATELQAQWDSGRYPVQ